MRYMKRAEYIDAVQYKLGMEDGFSCFPIRRECTHIYSERGRCDTCTINTPKIPYIISSRIIYIYKDNWIVTDDGKKYVCSKEDLRESYIEFPEPSEDVLNKIALIKTGDFG